MEIQPITGVFGARVTGVDLGEPLDDAAFDEIAANLRRYKVLNFPDQPNLTPQRHLALSQRFGEVETVPHPTFSDLPGCPGLRVLEADGTLYGDGDTWHTDGSARQNPRWISLLQAIDVPPYGRDTVFADMEEVLARLSPAMQAFLEQLTALHSWGPQKPEAAPVEHPVVRTDPATGRKWLYVNCIYTRKIVQLDQRESDALLQFLFECVHSPHVQLRVGWKPKDLTIWDNDTTQHFIVSDLKVKRVMHRAMVSAA